MLDGPLITAFSPPKAATGRQPGRRLSEELDNVHKYNLYLYKYKYKDKFRYNYNNNYNFFTKKQL